jgi:hypothetical protein
MKGFLIFLKVCFGDPRQAACTLTTTWPPYRHCLNRLILTYPFTFPQ